MYISNSNNIGMATLLQQNKSCVKTITNGTSGNIIVGNVVSTSQPTASSGNVVSTAGGSIVLPATSQGTTILLTNGATGASSIISLQQYQQLLQQQQQLQLQSNAMVSVPVANLVSSNGNLSAVSSATNTNTVNQTIFVTSNAAAGHHKTFATNHSGGFQQQFQQHAVSTVVPSSAGLHTRIITQTANGVLQQQTQNQANTTNPTGTTRYFAQFSQSQQQQQPAAVNVSNGPRTILISRHPTSSVTPRLNQPTIITKAVVSSNNHQTTQQQNQQPPHQVYRSQTIVRSAPAIIKSIPAPTPTLAPAPPAPVVKKEEPKTVETVEPPKVIPVVQQQNHRYGISTLQQLKLQQQAKLEEQEKNAAAKAVNGTDENKSSSGDLVNGEKVSSQGENKEDEIEKEPEIDIVINNVVCSFSVRCHLNLREIALNGSNVEYRRENGMVTMKLRRPYTTASIWSSGRITCTGATSEAQAKIAARRYARCLEKLGFRVRFNNFRVVNVLGTCSMPWAIKIVNFSEKYKKEASYEPELHPGVTYKLRFPKATLKIFSTGSITVTSASVANVQAAIEHIYPLVFEFRKKRSPQELEQLRLKQQAAGLLHMDPEVVDPESLNEIIEFDPADIKTNPDLEDEDADAESSSLHNSTPAASIKPTTIRTFQSAFHPASPSHLKNHKRRKLNASNNQSSIFDDEENDLDNPEAVSVLSSDATETNLDDFIEYSDPEDLIEGPDDEVIQV